jgi:DNA-binding MarR family transcriptional regulator
MFIDETIKPIHDQAEMPSPQRSRRRSTEAQRLLDLLNALGSTTFRQFLWQRASELDLTYAQSQVLFYVGDHAGCHMGEVGKAFGVTLPAVTHIIDRLEQKQFVARGDHPVDRRVYVLELTPQGQTLVEELLTMRLRALENVLARMSGSDRARVIKGLEALVDAAEKVSRS